MANLSTRNDPNAFFSELGSPFDPFQSMRDMMRWEPFSELFRGMPQERMQWFNPTFDVRETNDAFVLMADVPGMTEKDIDLQLTNNRLVISGQRQMEEEQKGETHHRTERSWGSFTRTFTLPAEIDSNKVSAELKNGVLTVQLPKTGGSMTKRITVQGERK
jgi:HSP20 family protein